jgi:hypothetical protein
MCGDEGEARQQGSRQPPHPPWTTHHPPPALQATACEVDGGWSDDGEARGDGRGEGEMRGG